MEEDVTIPFPTSGVMQEKPALHYFNPGHESAVLNGSPYYMSPSNVVAMQNDLAFLPAWYALPGDFVLVKAQLPSYFTSGIAAIGGSLATALTREDMLGGVLSLPPIKAVPWGVSPQSLYLFEELRQSSGCTIDIPIWDDIYARLCGRQTAALCLRSLLQVLPDSDKKILPRFRQSIQEIETILRESTSLMLIKAPFSSSGRGLLWLAGKELSRLEHQWISGVLKKQGAVSIEPALNKKQDFAMEFYSDGVGTVRFEGFSFFSTAEQGAYMGNFLGSQAEIKHKIVRLTGTDLLDEISETLLHLLQAIYGYQYKGFLGVDMMVYEDAKNALHLHPCVEINMRYTMGMVALSLSEKLLAPKAQGLFSVTYHGKEGEALQTVSQMQADYPLRQTEGRIKSGYLSLCPVNEETKYVASVLLSDTF